MTATKKQLARWAALKNRKDRLESGLFLAEGRKLVQEIVAAGWVVEAMLDEREQIERVSSLRTAPDLLAVVRLPPAPLSLWTPGSLVFLLDGVQDPGNLGTILRNAAWFGFSAVVCSLDSADPWQPKVIQATMGAFLRLSCAVLDPLRFLESLPAGTPVLGAVLNGDSLWTSELPKDGIVVLGNEGHGIRGELLERLTGRFTIPQFGSGGESLNVASASALFGAEFRRRMV
jgi:TrmH family RNA methyltransferase